MKKRHILVIGGTSGIGASLVKAFAKGSKVSVIGRHIPLVSEKNPPNVNYWIADLSDPVLLEKTLKAIILKNGKISSLLFFQRYRGKEDDWSGEVSVSLTATKNIIEFLSAEFAAFSEKSIVIASSLASQYIAKEQPLSYHVAKAGLNQLARFFAVRLGEKGIRVNCVVYGAVLKEQSKRFWLKHKKLLRLYKSVIPLKKMATCEDIAGAVEFLCSKKAAFITGQNLIIDGGVSLISQETLSRDLTSLKNLKIVRN